MSDPTVAHERQLNQHRNPALPLHAQNLLRRPRILNLERDLPLILLQDGAARELGVLDTQALESRTDAAEGDFNVTMFRVPGMARVRLQLRGSGTSSARGRRRTDRRSGFGHGAGFRRMLNHRNCAFNEFHHEVTCRGQIGRNPDRKAYVADAKAAVLIRWRERKPCLRTGVPHCAFSATGPQCCHSATLTPSGIRSGVCVATQYDGG